MLKATKASQSGGGMSLFRKELKIQNTFESILDFGDEETKEEKEKEEKKEEEEDSLHDKVQAEENEIVKRKASNALLPAASGTAIM